jgi:hypothetical protein
MRDITVVLASILTLYVVFQWAAPYVMELVGFIYMLYLLFFG